MKKNTAPNYAAVKRFEHSEARVKLDTLINEARWLATASKSRFEDKADRLVSIAEEMSRAITPFTPCGKGCSHCCYMAVEVSSFEADMIGRYLGRDKQDVGQNIQADAPDSVANRQEESWRRWTGVRCSLLGDDGKCTVYPVRPIACRTHHNLAVDETNCVCTSGPLEDLPTTPHLNLNEFQMYSAVILWNGKSTWADLREWFPNPNINPNEEKK